ncbi:O-methyltransferase [Burkholderia reimsis]|uniref:O-methyltransferase n=1 Tax=Burkholderia reimsis TaxID=2234132 RepID=UPI0010591D27|nr:O-methyltransferase [Burkholderia reimsis]
MSAGGSIPYHLRQNKAIERNLFIDLLSRVGRYRNISDYAYVGFGGPFLEDFKYLHSTLRLTDMTSIEIDINVFNRQKFNKPISCVKLVNQSSSEFLTDHSFIKPSVVWFDYARPSDLGLQLAETQNLVAKLGEGDIFKITLNATPETLGSPPRGEDLREFRRDKASIRLGQYGPVEITVDDVTNANYPKLLLAALKSAARQGVQGNRRVYVQPLSSFLYRDGQQMLTATGILLSPTDKDKFLRETRLEHWKFHDFEWDVPRSISVPEMSVKERLAVESYLPESPSKSIIDQMGYHIGNDEDEALGLMENFSEFYRMFPWYSKVVM